MSNLPPGVTDRMIDEAAGDWGCSDEPEPDYRVIHCHLCGESYAQDDWTQRWYKAEDVEDFGMDHVRQWFSYSVDTPYDTKQGWVCSSKCHYDPEYQGAA